jgi:hypothetical protein
MKSRLNSTVQPGSFKFSDESSLILRQTFLDLMPNRWAIHLTGYLLHDSSKLFSILSRYLYSRMVKDAG